MVSNPAIGQILTPASRLLIEAIEGCGIRHWAYVEEWDGESRTVIRDLGGDRFVLTAEDADGLIENYRAANPDWDPDAIDSYTADVILQSALFGSVIYRTGVRRRPITMS